MEREDGARKVDAQTAVTDMIKELRSNPRRYQALRRKVHACKTDRERAALLVDFSMKEETIRGHIPEQPQAFIWTITTITTVLVGDTRKPRKEETA